MTEMVKTDIQIGNTVYTYVEILITESFKKQGKYYVQAKIFCA